MNHLFFYQTFPLHHYERKNADKEFDTSFSLDVEQHAIDKSISFI